MKYACGKCERLVEENQMIQPISGGPMICATCAGGRAPIPVTSWLPIASWIASGAAILMAILSLVVTLKESRRTSALEELMGAVSRAHLEVRRQFAVGQELVINNNPSRTFSMLPYSNSQSPLAQCLLTLSAKDFERMTKAEREELLGVQKSIWHTALRNAYGTLPPGSSLVIMTSSSLGKEKTMVYGRFVDGDWQPEDTSKSGAGER